MWLMMQVPPTRWREQKRKAAAFEVANARTRPPDRNHNSDELAWLMPYLHKWVSHLVDDYGYGCQRKSQNEPDQPMVCKILMDAFTNIDLRKDFDMWSVDYPPHSGEVKMVGEKAATSTLVAELGERWCCTRSLKRTWDMRLALEGPYAHMHQIAVRTHKHENAGCQTCAVLFTQFVRAKTPAARTAVAADRRGHKQFAHEERLFNRAFTHSTEVLRQSGVVSMITDGYDTRKTTIPMSGETNGLFTKESRYKFVKSKVRSELYVRDMQCGSVQEREAADDIRGLTFEYNHIAALGVPVVMHWG
jgi:hypothetical protein